MRFSKILKHSMENPEEMEDNSVQVGNISETTNDKILN
jgi:hypothetical protein